MEVKTDQSYGVIPVKKIADSWHFFLINQIDRFGGSFWTLPKGHPEPGEAPGLAAKRELFEETGLSLDELLTEKAYCEEYTYLENEETINKRVIYFIGLVAEGESVLQESEVLDGRWCTFAEAIALLPHSNKQEIIKEAENDLFQLQDYV